MPAFSYANLCYATPSDALPAFVSSFPYQDASFITQLATFPVPAINSAGLITYNLIRKNLATNATTNIATTLQLSKCTKPDLPYDYSTGAGFWAFGFSGVMVMYFTSHAIGLVLETIRKR